MTAATLSSLIIAAVAILGAISSVLALSYRVGKLTGSVEARISHGETDRVNIWRAIGALTSKMDRHIDTHLGIRRD